MHPKEMSHMALVAANAAQLDGFQAVADAFLALAAACEDVARWASQPDQAFSPKQSLHRPPSDQDIVFFLH